MENTSTTTASQTQKPPRGKRIIVAGVLLALLATGIAGAWFVLQPRHSDTPALAEIPPNPQLVYPTKYENVRPSVAYVDDAKCVKCHTGHGETFAEHSMGKSFGTFESMPKIENYSQPQIFNAPGNFQYEVKLTKTGVNHIERKLDNAGKVICEEEFPVAYVFGSGGRGRSYLIKRGDALYESPISWYSQKGIWDLSPGYEHRNHHFQRPIVTDCLLCHTNRHDPVPDSLNRYKGEMFHGLSIGCQRCHGPGELHVKFREGSAPHDGDDYTIVNPAKLDPLLRESVCQQCHLHGKVAVDRIGRSKSQFRPGLPLDAFVSYFEVPDDPMDHAVGQVEQMHASTCFKKSPENNKLGCISCHNPHSLPEPQEKISYYRAQCLNCHGSTQVKCKVPEARRARENGNSCYSCHMPRYGSSDIVHTSMSDHRILVRPKLEHKPLVYDVSKPLVAFHHSPSASKSAELSRDTGLALARFTQSDPRIASLSLKHLRSAAKELQPDRDALFAEANCLLGIGERSKAIQKINQAVELAPNWEAGLSLATSMHWELNQPREAMKYAERQAALNPTLADVTLRLARMYAMEGDHNQAAARARKAIELMPTNLEARFLLIRSLVALGKKSEAETVFEQFARFNPPNLYEVRRMLSQDEKK